MSENKLDAKGLLHQGQSLEHFKLEFFTPSDDISSIIDRFWWVSWNLENGDEYQQSNLPFPTQHLVIDPVKSSGFFGCSNGKFDYVLTGTGNVLGAKFRPGLGQSLVKKSMSELLNQRMPLGSLFPEDAERLETRIQNGNIEQAVVELSDLISANANEPTADQMKVNRTISIIEESNEVYSLTTLSEKVDISIRTLQRLFQEHIGLGPKWVIDRYRIFDALEDLNNQRDVDFADLAVKLNYTDQAHFNKVFKALTGESPAAYHKAQEAFG